jgi:hypothetical protein
MAIQLDQQQSEAFIAASTKASGRACGSCSMCCKLMDVPEVPGKREDEWCPHCRPGKGGCSIYATRPQRCRYFACLWLINPTWTDEWFPAKSKIVPDMRLHDGVLQLRLFVDPQYRNRWREEPYASAIKELARKGLRSKDRYETIVTVGRETMRIIPKGD